MRSLIPLPSSSRDAQLVLDFDLRLRWFSCHLPSAQYPVPVVPSRLSRCFELEPNNFYILLCLICYIRKDIIM